MADEIFSPDTNYEDQELLENVLKAEKATAYIQQKRGQEHNDNLTNHLWNEALKEAGLDPATYAAMAAQDPEGTLKSVKSGMVSLVNAVKKGRGQPQPQPQPQTGQPQSHQPAPPAPPVDNRAELERIRQKANTGPLTADDEDAIIDTLFGGPTDRLR